MDDKNERGTIGVIGITGPLGATGAAAEKPKTRDHLIAEYEQACADYRAKRLRHEEAIRITQEASSAALRASVRADDAGRALLVAVGDRHLGFGSDHAPILSQAQLPKLPAYLSPDEHDVWVKAYTAAREKHVSSGTTAAGEHGPAGLAAREAGAAVAAYRKLRDAPAES